MGKVITIETFVRDPDWLDDQEISPAQMGGLKALYGMPFNDWTQDEKEVFMEIAEGRKPRAGGYSEATLICGIRSGKTDKFAANAAAYDAIMFDPSMLAPGEKAYIPVIAQNIEGAKTAWGYIEGKARLLEEKGVTFPDGTPLLDPGINKSGTAKAVTGKEIRFSNRVVVQTFPCNKAGIRGKTCITGIGDEFAFWQTADTADSSDLEIFRALRGRMATMRGKGKLIKITSPYIETGVAYEDFRNRKTSRRLFIQAPSWVLNPSLSQRYLDEQRAEDPEGFNREFGAQFGKGGGTFLLPYWVDDAMSFDRPDVIQPQLGKLYMGWVDVGFKHDLYAFGIAHREGDRVVFDVIMWWKGTVKEPLDGRDIAKQIAAVLRGYGLDEVNGDQYAAVPVSQHFTDAGVQFREVADTADRAWEAFSMLKTQLRHKNVDLPKIDMVKQDLLSLVFTKTGQNGTPRVAAPNRSGFHDDISKVISNLVLHFAPAKTKIDISEWNAGADMRKQGVEGESWHPTNQPQERDEYGDDDLFDGGLMDREF